MDIWWKRTVRASNRASPRLLSVRDGRLNVAPHLIPCDVLLSFSGLEKEEEVEGEEEKNYGPEFPPLLLPLLRGGGEQTSPSSTVLLTQPFASTWAGATS